MENKVDPKSQEQFDIFVSNGLSILHDQEVSDGILNRIMNGDPIEGIANATVDIVTRLADSAAQSGMALSDDVLVQGGNVIMGEIISMAEAAGMQKLTEEQRSKAFELATSKYLADSVESGRVSPEQMMQLGEQAKQSPQGQQIEGQMGQEVQGG